MIFNSLWSAKLLLDIKTGFDLSEVLFSVRYTFILYIQKTKVRWEGNGRDIQSQFGSLKYRYTQIFEDELTIGVSMLFIYPLFIKSYTCLSYLSR